MTTIVLAGDSSSDGVRTSSSISNRPSKPKTYVYARKLEGPCHSCGAYNQVGPNRVESGKGGSGRYREFDDDHDEHPWGRRRYRILDRRGCSPPYRWFRSSSPETNCDTSSAAEDEALSTKNSKALRRTLTNLEMKVDDIASDQHEVERKVRAAGAESTKLSNRLAKLRRKQRRYGDLLHEAEREEMEARDRPLNMGDPANQDPLLIKYAAKPSVQIKRIGELYGRRKPANYLEDDENFKGLRKARERLDAFTAITKGAPATPHGEAQISGGEPDSERETHLGPMRSRKSSRKTKHEQPTVEDDSESPDYYTQFLDGF